MRKKNDAKTEHSVDLFYMNLDMMAKDRGVTLKDLSIAIGLAPRTLSSMKSQHQNPGLMTMVKLAKYLDASLDEFIDEKPIEHGKTNDLIWFLYQIKDSEKNEFIVDQLSTIGKTLADDKTYIECSRFQLSAMTSQRRIKARLHNIAEHERIANDPDAEDISFWSED